MVRALRLSQTAPRLTCTACPTQSPVPGGLPPGLLLPPKAHCMLKPRQPCPPLPRLPPLPEVHCMLQPSHPRTGHQQRRIRPDPHLLQQDDVQLHAQSCRERREVRYGVYGLDQRGERSSSRSAKRRDSPHRETPAVPCLPRETTVTVARSQAGD